MSAGQVAQRQRELKVDGSALVPDSRISSSSSTYETLQLQFELFLRMERQQEREMLSHLSGRGKASQGEAKQPLPQHKGSEQTVNSPLYHRFITQRLPAE